MEQHRSGLYRPCLQDGVSQRGEDLMSVDQCEVIREMDDSQLVGAPEASGGAGENGRVAEVEVKTVDARLEKKKRGRPPRGLPKAVKTSAAPRKKKDEEDVCFICFDGGSLVLCDRRGCPKAYHPACIKRDESFFKSRAKWNCGWHICSICQKAAHYMCYTCTYSLCKGCIKDADYLSVRGNNGLCGTCMRTVMLIENLQGDKEVAQVDFDDKSSWEYLFKMYWIFLKRKLSLTLDELTRAKNPWKGIDTLACKGEHSAEYLKVDDYKGSSFNNRCAGSEANNSKRRKTKKRPAINNKSSLSMERSGYDNSLYPLGGMKWASKELLEFVAHIKDGDTSTLSQFDVQTLLQEYVKKNSLRDPCQKCQIVCDSRLMKLFGKERVGHIEMLKLLESHFLVKESCSADDILRMGVVNGVADQMKTEANDDNQLLLGSGRRHKIRKKADQRGSKTNLDAFAAIDVHNINLIYLRRNLMEALIDDADKFHDKVVGSIVRISVPNNDQKQELYRLVQVVGTRKVAEPYKLGERTTDMMLEILNLDKRDTLSIEGISNQEFSEDECERLRQSVKCGLIKQLTVGEIRAKAMVLQAVRVNDVLEAEILRLNHLRDRANEKGHKKELRECVEKLQLLNSPDERQRRLNEIPEVHTDPKVDPIYESVDNVGEVYGKKQDDKLRSKLSGNGRKGGRPTSARKGGDVLVNIGNCVKKKLAKSCEQSRKVGVTSSWNREIEASGIHRWNTPANQVNTSGSLAISWNGQAVLGSELFSGFASELSISTVSSETGQSTNDFETKKLWYYRDPTGRIQGPFSMQQLRKWSTTGHFPSNLRVWRGNEQQDDSVLLTDALSGQYHRTPSLPGNNKLPLGVGVALDDKDNIHDVGGSGSMNTSWIHGKEVEECSKLKQDDSSVHADGSDDFLESNGYRTHSPSWSNPADVTNTDGKMNAVVQRGWDSSNSSCTLPSQLGPHSPGRTNPADGAHCNGRMSAIIQPGWDSSNGSSSLPDQLPGCSSSITPPASSGKSCETLSHKVGEGHGAESNSAMESGKCNSHSAADGQTKNERGYENHSDSEGHSGQSSGQSSRHPTVTSNGLISSSDFISVVKSLETAEKNQEIDFPDFPSSTTQQQSNEDSKVLAAESKQAASSSVPIQDAGPSWSTASSLVGSGAQIPEVVGEWPRHSPTPAKHAVEEWDSSLGSAPSMKPAELVSDHAATQTSISEQLTQSSPPHPASNTSSWPAAISTETNEFGSLAGESVSDLLAEVEAMESLDGLPSPTSNMNCGETLTEDSKNDCISALDGLSPAFDPGKGDALSSTGDLQVPSQSTVTDEPHGICQADVLDTQKRCSGHSPTSIEVDGDAKPSDIPVNQWKRGSDIQPTRPSRASWNVGARDTTWRPGSESTATSWRPAQGSANLGWGGFDQRSVNTGWGPVHVPTPDRLCTNLPASAGNPSIWGAQPRYGGDRSSSPRDRGLPGRDVTYGWGRGTWNRQPLYVGGNGGGPHRHVPKGQRVCKYYGSGNCWKGASCDYWHP